MTRPNLFSYATSELSQDAMICWLLAWASPDCADEDSELHECGRRLIEALFKVHDRKPPENIRAVEVLKQYEHIDVFCVINGKYAVIIEDKTGTVNHSNQLKTYFEKIRKDYPEKDILRIYYKTEDQSSYKKIKEEGYKAFLRREILDVLETYEGDNPILLDYLNHLQCIENEVNSFLTKPIKKWTRYQWIGFFKRLQNELGLKEKHWRYVPNPSGGFLGFYWHGQDRKDFDQYLLLEEEKLCFKISVENASNRKQLRDRWHSALMEVDKASNCLTKPDRFGLGKDMTVCVFEAKDYRAEVDGELDLKATLEILRRAERFLDKTRERMK